MSALVKKVLIANRGEIAVRIARACREMGIATAAVYSECDRAALHVRYADEAYAIGPSPPRESYLRIDRILDAARARGRRRRPSGLRLSRGERGVRRRRPRRGAHLHRTDARSDGADGQQDGGARHRGCGPACRWCRAPTRRSATDVPDEEIARAAETIGYPLLVKAVAGGGGKGMRTVVDRADLARRVRAARSEAGTAFGDTAVYLERRLSRPRHVEVQLLGGSPRHRAAVRGARMFDPAAASEGRRGEPVAGGDAGDPASDHGRRGVGGARRRLHQCRNDRVPARRGRPLLLPGDEHAAAGRAPDHRDGDRRRSGAVADSHRARRAARPRSGAAADPERPRDRVPHLRGGSRQQLSAVAGPDRRPARAGRAGHPRRQRRRRRARRADLLRSDDLEAGGVGARIGRPRSRACAARWPSTSSPASRRRCRFSGGCSTSPSSSRAGSTRRISIR